MKKPTHLWNPSNGVLGEMYLDQECWIIISSDDIGTALIGFIDKVDGRVITTTAKLRDLKRIEPKRPTIWQQVKRFFLA